MENAAFQHKTIIPSVKHATTDGKSILNYTSKFYKKISGHKSVKLNLK